MVEIWSEVDLSDRIKKEELLSLSRSSKVSLLTLADGQLAVAKSYSPQSNPEYKKTYGQNPVLSNQSYYRNPAHYFKKERQLLEQLSKTGVVPLPIAVVPDLKTIVMEYGGDELFSDRLLEAERNYENGDREVKKNILRERLLTHLINFYEQTEELSEKRIQEVLASLKNKGRDPSSLNVNLRTFEEENMRLRHYFFKLIYGFSEEFKNQNSGFYDSPIPLGRKDRNKKWEQVKGAIKNYLQTKGIEFDSLINEFQKDYNYLTVSVEDLKSDENHITVLENRKMRFIHGDFGPHNVLHVKNKFGKILDLNECRIDRPSIDVGTALFNLFSCPTESRVPRLIDDFWKKMPLLHKGYPDFPDLLVGCLATRVHQDIRIASRNIDYSLNDILRFTKGHPKYEKDPELPAAEREALFKSDRIEDLKNMIPYYTIGEGYSVVLENCPKRERLKRLFETIKHLLQVTYSMDVPATERYTGKKVDKLGKLDEGL